MCYAVNHREGNTYAFVAPKNKSREPVNEHFYDPKNKITRDLLARFNDINPDRLRAGTFTSVANHMAVVDNKCTIAAMIRLNAASLGVDVNELPPDGTENFFAIDRRVVDACMARYEEEKNLGFHDMRNLELSFTRIDSPKDWANPAGTTPLSRVPLKVHPSVPQGVCDNIARRTKTDLQHADNTRLNNKYTISGEIEIELNLFGTGPVETQ